MNKHRNTNHRRERRGSGWSPSGIEYQRTYTEKEPMQVLGRHGGCWCRKEINHDWPGKEDGAPHPR